MAGAGDGFLSRRRFLILGGLVATGSAGAALARRPLRPTARRADDELDAFIADRMRAAHLPGLAVALTGPGGVLWTGSYGWADVEDAIPVTPDTRFLLASVSKTVTAVALMQIHEDHGIDLDSDVEAHLPFALRHPRDSDTPITFRMLLTHTAGIRDNWDVLEPLVVDGDSPIPLADFCAGYLTPSGDWHAAGNFGRARPGAAYDYSNVGTALLGYLVERIAGLPFDTFCRRRIFEPLGMPGASWRLAGQDLTTLAVPYSRERGRSVRHAHYGFPDYPNGSLRAGAAELARFLAAFTRFGELDDARILRSETVAEMRREQIPLLEPGQGLIWYRTGRGEDALLGHDGGELGARTAMFFRPADGLGVVLLANGGAEEDAEEQAFQELLDRFFVEAERRAAPGPTAAASPTDVVSPTGTASPTAAASPIATVLPVGSATATLVATPPPAFLPLTVGAAEETP